MRSTRQSGSTSGSLPPWSLESSGSARRHWARASRRPADGGRSHHEPRTGSGGLFTDLEQHVEVWQRVRGSTPIPIFGSVPAIGPEAPSLNVADLVQSFRLGYRELREIWTWVLPPRTIVELRKLTETVPISFGSTTDSGPPSCMTLRWATAFTSRPATTCAAPWRRSTRGGWRHSRSR